MDTSYPTSFNFRPETRQLLEALSRELGLTRTALTELGYLLLAECFLPAEAASRDAALGTLDMGRQMVLDRALALIRRQAHPPSPERSAHGQTEID